MGCLRGLGPAYGGSLWPATLSSRICVWRLILGRPPALPLPASGSAAPLGVAWLRGGLLAPFQRGLGVTDGRQARLCSLLTHAPWWRPFAPGHGHHLGLQSAGGCEPRARWGRGEGLLFALASPCSGLSLGAAASHACCWPPPAVPACRGGGRGWQQDLPCLLGDGHYAHPPGGAPGDWGGVCRCGEPRLQAGSEPDRAARPRHGAGGGQCPLLPAAQHARMRAPPGARGQREQAAARGLRGPPPGGLRQRVAGRLPVPAPGRPLQAGRAPPPQGALPVGGSGAGLYGWRHRGAGPGAQQAVRGHRGGRQVRVLPHPQLPQAHQRRGQQ